MIFHDLSVQLSIELWHSTVFVLNCEFCSTLLYRTKVHFQERWGRAGRVIRHPTSVANRGNLLVVYVSLNKERTERCLVGDNTHNLLAYAMVLVVCYLFNFSV